MKWSKTLGRQGSLAWVFALWKEKWLYWALHCDQCKRSQQYSTRLFCSFWGNGTSWLHKHKLNWCCLQVRNLRLCTHTHKKQKKKRTLGLPREMTCVPHIIRDTGFARMSRNTSFLFYFQLWRSSPLHSGKMKSYSQYTKKIKYRIKEEGKVERGTITKEDKWTELNYNDGT